MPFEELTNIAETYKFMNEAVNTDTEAYRLTKACRRAPSILAHAKAFEAHEAAAKKAKKNSPQWHHHQKWIDYHEKRVFRSVRVKRH